MFGRDNFCCKITRFCIAKKLGFKNNGILIFDIFFLFIFYFTFKNWFAYIDKTTCSYFVIVSILFSQNNVN